MSRPSIPNTFTPERKARFLEVLEETASPKAAAAAVGIVRSTAFYHRANDLEFRKQWEAAVEVALDALLEEAYRRSVVGHDEPLVHQGRLSTVTDPVTGEERVQTIRKYSDRLMEVLLKWVPADGRQAVRQGRGHGPVGRRASPDAGSGARAARGAALQVQRQQGAGR